MADTHKGPNVKHMDRVAQAFGSGASAEDVKAMLKREGLSDYDCYLAYKGAKLLHPEAFDFSPDTQPAG